MPRPRNVGFLFMVDRQQKLIELNKKRLTPEKLIQTALNNIK